MSATGTTPRGARPFRARTICARFSSGVQKRTLTRLPGTTAIARRNDHESVLEALGKSGTPSAADAEKKKEDAEKKKKAEAEKKKKAEAEKKARAKDEVRSHAPQPHSHCSRLTASTAGRRQGGGDGEESGGQGKS